MDLVYNERLGALDVLMVVMLWARIDTLVLSYGDKHPPAVSFVILGLVTLFDLSNRCKLELGAYSCGTQSP